MEKIEQIIDLENLTIPNLLECERLYKELKSSMDL
jgi:hypothetical protein